jgi:hypothetical protein
MGRIKSEIEVDGRRCWTLFDTGARNTYVTPEVAALLGRFPADHPLRTALGGSIRESNVIAVLQAKVEGQPISTHAYVLDNIGADEQGKPIEVLFGALAMQQWGIRPIPDEERLDLTHYPHEFVEFIEF